jgi:hypothetical protein
MCNKPSKRQFTANSASGMISMYQKCWNIDARQTGWPIFAAPHIGLTRRGQFALFLPRTISCSQPHRENQVHTRGATFVSLLASSLHHSFHDPGSAGEGQEQPFPLETWRRGCSSFLVGSDHGSSPSRLAAKAVNSCLPWREPAEGASHLRGHEVRTRMHRRADEQFHFTDRHDQQLLR